MRIQSCLLLILCATASLSCDESPISPNESSEGTSRLVASPSEHPPGGDTTLPDTYIKDHPTFPFGDVNFDLLPLSRYRDSTSRYSGISAPMSGVCHAVPVHSYKLDSISDTMQIDMWMITKCKAGGGNYDSMRIFLDMSSARFRDMVNIELQIDGGLPFYLTATRRFTERVPDPYMACFDPPVLRAMAYTRYINLPRTLMSCRDGSLKDTMRLRMKIIPPFVDSAYTTVPAPINISVELMDPRNEIIRRSPFYFTTRQF